MEAKNRQMEKTGTKIDQPYTALCAGVVAQACKDYRCALRAKKRNIKSLHDQFHEAIDTDYTIRECEHFFRHDLELWSDLDGEWLMKSIREMVNND